MTSLLEKKFEKQLTQIFSEKIKDLTPGLVVQAFLKGEKKIDIEVGETSPYYDLASLTKSIFTTSAAMHLYDENPKILEEKVLKHLEWFVHPTVNVRELLTHTSGLSWWKPLYISLDISQPREKRWESLKYLIANEQVEERPTSVYSDLNYLLLGYVLESYFKKDLLSLWTLIQENFDLRNTNFHVNNKPVHAVTKYAPTEQCPWRQKRLQGEVHDENAWALGGVAPHSGLFGTIDDLSKWILKLREVAKNVDTNFLISPATIEMFMRRAISQDVGDFSLGFMMKSQKDSTCGQFFSKQSVGHTGFTGTSFWYDPDADLIVTILSNRVFYGRDKGVEFKILRQFIHDEIYKGLVQG